MSTSTSKKSNPDEIIWEVREDEKSWWKKRSALEKKLVVSFVVTVVVFIGIFIFMSVKPSEAQKQVGCSSNECVTSASQIFNSIDVKVDPCEDFYHFACAKLEKDTIGDDINSEILDALREPITSGDHFTVKSQKALFQGCMNEEELNEESLAVIQTLIKELNEWPVVFGHRWRDKQFDWAETVIKLRKKGYKDDMILNVQMTKKDGKVIPLVTPPSVTAVEKEDVQLYIKYMSDVVQLFGAEQNRADMEMEKVYDFMEKLNEIEDKFWQYDNDTRVKITEFQEEYDDIDWYKFLYNMVSSHKLSAKDLVSFPNSDYMDAFSLLMTKTPQRIQATYIIWAAIEDLIPFLPKAYRDLQDNYMCISKNQMTRQERPELCLSTVENAFVLSPMDILYMRKHLTESKRDSMIELFESIRAETMNFIENLQWLDKSDADNLISTLNDTSVVIGVEGDYSKDSIFEKYNGGPSKRSYGGAFLSMYLNQRKQTLDMRQRMAAEDLLLGQLITYTSPFIHSEASKMVLPIAMLTKKFYDPEGPKYLSYGALGKEIASELVHNLIFENRGSGWSNSSIEMYTKRMNCVLKSSASDLKDEETRRFLDDGAFAYFYGIKIAYDAYQEWVKENGEEAVPAGLHYTSNQLFWIAALADECYDKTELMYVHFQKLFEKNLPVVNIRDFSVDYECSPDSKMNREDVCEIW